MIHLDPKKSTVQEVHKLLLGGVAPRPIALVSTLSSNGINNLSPFSFFNAFGANPPIIAFSPSRKGKSGELKDTYNNLVETKQCVVQAVTYDMVEQISLASTEYPPDVDEFVKSGLTPVNSEIVKPKRVKESPFQMECILREMISFGQQGGSANLAICEVVLFHVEEDIFENGIIHPDKIDLAARMSANFYCRASGNSVFEIEKPISKIGIGIDELPDYIKKSDIYSANNLAKFANVESIPSLKTANKFIEQEIKNSKYENFEASRQAIFRYEKRKDYKRMLKAVLIIYANDKNKMILYLEKCAKIALESNDIKFAWLTAVYSGSLM